MGAEMTASNAITADVLHAKLTAAFSPDYLNVIDESDQHQGHGGWREGGGTHFRVVMRAAAFDKLSRVERSRAVHAVLRDELLGGVHALALELAGEIES